MELACQEQLIARLATDREFREAFFTDPARVAATEGWTAAVEALGPLHHEQMRQFARLLRTRRLALVGQRLPGTRKALGPRFGEVFRYYAVLTAPPGETADQDAQRFAKYLGEYAGEHELSPAWVLSLARYEALGLQAEAKGRQFTVRVFPHAVKKLMALLAAGEVPPGEYRRKTTAIWWRAAARRRLRHKLI